MAANQIINVDLARVFDSHHKLITTLAWGDEVEVVEQSSDTIKIRLLQTTGDDDHLVAPQQTIGLIKPPRGTVPIDKVLASKEDLISAGRGVLKVDFVDVQQGDGCVIETATGQVVLIDGGGNQLFARYLASRFPNTSAAEPKAIDCIVVSHGDADHFAGLPLIHESERHRQTFKRLFISPKRVYHNGLVKRPTNVGNRKLGELEMFGTTVELGDDRVIVDLKDDLRNVDDSEMNQPFRQWKNALVAFGKRGEMAVRRLSDADTDAFEFLHNDHIKVDILGPMLTPVGDRKGLKFLREPTPRVERQILIDDTATPPHGSPSASHTINGHSIVLQLAYGQVKFLFAGDLNEEAEQTLVQAHSVGPLNLRADIFKVPHHGSADFAPAFLKAVAPLISVVSAGDESSRVEFIHPRAGLMGALGKCSRAGVDEPLIFVTELAAFFQLEGYVLPVQPLSKEQKQQFGDVRPYTKQADLFFAFRRASFGIVRIRTDGQRILVYTNSGRPDRKEAYAYQLTPGQDTEVIPKPVTVQIV